MGELWEPGVKNFKTNFRNLVNAMEEVSTLFTKMKAWLRPTIPLSPSPDSREPLRPGHFLFGNPLLVIAEREIVNQWQKIKGIHHGSCQRWKAEYLKEL